MLSLPYKVETFQQSNTAITTYTLSQNDKDTNCYEFHLTLNTNNDDINSDPTTFIIHLLDVVTSLPTIAYKYVLDYNNNKKLHCHLWIALHEFHLYNELRHKCHPFSAYITGVSNRNKLFNYMDLHTVHLFVDTDMVITPDVPRFLTK